LEAVATPQEKKYVIAVDNFEGPLDLLWNLIKSSRLDITEISLSMITEQYIGYLKLMDVMNIQIASEFIVMASELLYYKSKALLPGDELEDEYFVPPLPPDLIEKLLEYKKYQEAAGILRERHELQSDCFIRCNEINEHLEEEIYIEVSLFELLRAFAEVIDSHEVIEQQEIVFDEILVSDRIQFIAELLEKQDHIIFSDLFGNRPGRPLIIASFLAILEMAKSRKIRIMQHTVFGEIRILKGQPVPSMTDGHF